MKKMLIICAVIIFTVGNAWGQTTITVGPGGDYATIQAAINATTTVDGDIIQIDAGIYPEALTVGKSLTFIGSGAPSNPTTIITSTASRVIRLTATGKSFTFQNLIVEGIDTNLGIYAHGSIDINSLTMQNVIARNCKVALYLAEYWPTGGPFTTTVNNLSMDNVTLTNNKFIGAYIGKTVLSGIVTNCTVTDNGYSDELPASWQKTGLQFVNFDEASVPHVVVTNSTFSNNGAGASDIERTGLIIYTAYNGFSASEIMTVSGCSFSNHPLYAVRIKNGYNEGNTAIVNGTFSSNYLDIWFNNIIGTTSSTLLVRNTFNGIKTVGTGPTYDYNTIQAAINAANPGDVIDVDAGTYNENVIVNIAVTLNGANADVTCGSRVSESIIAPGSGLPISVTANGVTINGFEITAPGYPNAIVCGNTSDLDIIFNNIHDIYGGTSSGSNAHGINYTVASSLAATVNVNISDNCFTDIGNFNNHEKSAKAIGVIQRSSTGTLTNLTIERNNISNVFAKKADWSSGGRIAYGIQLAVGSSNYLTTTGNVFNAQINDNDISNLEGFISTGIALEGNTENAVVKNNNISTLTGYKLVDTRDEGGYDLQGLKFEENRYVATCTVENNNFNADTYVHNGTFGLGYAIANYVPIGLTYTGGTTGKAVTSCNWHGTAVASDIADNATLTGKIFNKDNCETDFIPFWTAIDGSCDGGIPKLTTSINDVVVNANNDGSDDNGEFSVYNTTNNILFNFFTDQNGLADPNLKVYQTKTTVNVTVPFCNNCSATLGAFAGAKGTAALINPAIPGMLTMRFRSWVDANNDGTIDVGEFASDWIVYTMTITINSSYLKSEAKGLLTPYLSNPDKKIRKAVEKAIKHIDKSLDPELWSDANHLTKKGKKVFDEEKKAVKELTNKKFDELFSTAISYLLTADKNLAQLMIDKATIADGGDSKEIEKAEKEMEIAMILPMISFILNSIQVYKE